MMMLIRRFSDSCGGCCGSRRRWCNYDGDDGNDDDGDDGDVNGDGDGDGDNDFDGDDNDDDDDGDDDGDDDDYASYGHVSARSPPPQSPNTGVINPRGSRVSLADPHKTGKRLLSLQRDPHYNSRSVQTLEHIITAALIRYLGSGQKLSKSCSRYQSDRA